MCVGEKNYGASEEMLQRSVPSGNSSPFSKKFHNARQTILYLVITGVQKRRHVDDDVSVLQKTFVCVYRLASLLNRSVGHTGKQFPVYRIRTAIGKRHKALVVLIPVQDCA